MNCRYRQDAISSYIDGELLPKEAGELREHLAACVQCRRRLEELSEARQHLQGLSRVELPAGFAASLHTRLADENLRRHNAWWQRLMSGLSLPRRRFELAGAGALVLLLALVTMHGVQDRQYTDRASLPDAGRKEAVVEMKAPEKTAIRDAAKPMQPSVKTKQAPSPRLQEAPAQPAVPTGPAPTATVAESRQRRVGSPMATARTEEKADNYGTSSSAADTAAASGGLSAPAAPSKPSSVLRSAPAKARGFAAPEPPLLFKEGLAAPLVEQQPFADIKVERDRITIEVVSPASIRSGLSDAKMESATVAAARSLELRLNSGARHSFVLTDAGRWSGNWSVYIPRSDAKGTSPETILNPGSTTAARLAALADLSRNTVIAPAALEGQDLSATAARLDAWQSFPQAIPGIIPVNGNGYLLLLPQK